MLEAIEPVAGGSRNIARLKGSLVRRRVIAKNRWAKGLSVVVLVGLLSALVVAQGARDAVRPTPRNKKPPILCVLGRAGKKVGLITAGGFLRLFFNSKGEKEP